MSILKYMDADGHPVIVSASQPLPMVLGVVGLGVSSFSETVLATALTDGGAAAGTYSTTHVVPAGAVLLGFKVVVNVGFLENTTAVLKANDGAADILTGVNVFTAAPAGIKIAFAGAGKFIAADTNLLLTLTSTSDITPVVAGGGSLTITLYFLQT